MEPAFPRHYVALRKVDWRIVVGLISLNTICLFFYRQLDYVSNANYRFPGLTLAEETVGGLAGLAVFPLIYLIAVRFPFPSARWRFNLAVHLLAVCVISLIHTTLIALLRMAFFPLLGFAREGYGYLPARYPMEFSHLFIYYWFGVSLIYLFHEVRFARERELRQAKVEASLAEARLRNLQLQIEPHFLFNALNAISAAIYENPRAADRMVCRLGELLRSLLNEDRSQTIPLTREMEILTLYIGIMEARLEDRLSVSIDVEAPARQALVPQLILQPLVENAIRYGMDEKFEARVVILARRDGDSLYLSVRDHGPGIQTSKPRKAGLGLRNTTERLERLYYSEQSFEIRNAEGGGAIAEIRMPFQRTGEGQELSTDMQSLMLSRSLFETDAR